MVSKLDIEELLFGDCLEVLKEIPDNTIDSIVTDSPYGIKFMNKKWDYQIPSVEVWQECLRVLKPGGHLLCFGGTRTYHRMAVAVEDAGFEIRDQLMWVYGCLSEDTEILTDKGWVQYGKTILSNSVLCYDKEHDSFEWHKPTNYYEYQNQYPAYRIKSDKTDQIVSRNHRVLVEREGEMVFETAEQVARQHEASVPILESLQDLPDDICNSYQRAGGTKSSLFKRLQCQTNKQKENWTKEANTRKRNNTGKLCKLWGKISKAYLPSKKVTKPLLLSALQRKSEGTRVGKVCSFRFKKQKSGINRKNEGDNDWFSKSFVERWRDVFQEKGQLWVSKICEVSQRLFEYGKEGRLYYGTSFNHGAAFTTYFKQAGGSASYQPQQSGQQARKLDAFSVKQPAQKVRSTRAKVEEIDYNGIVWCVEVPTGAFVARRNGKIFITGNSGFPKSQNIGKAVDKLQGNERTTTGIKTVGGGGYSSGYESRFTPKTPETAKSGLPETKGHSEWEGYGTALKPAHEPIVLARKPIEKGLSIAQNCLKWGVGALNIDGCRVAANPGEYDIRHYDKEDCFQNKEEKQSQFQVRKQPSGRFPANFIHDGSDEVVGLFPNTKSGGGNKNAKINSTFCVSPEKNGRLNQETIGGDSGSAARFFYCAKAQKKERNKYMNEGEENKHPTVKPIKLMSYLINLVTPKGGLLLDLFVGSGTTLIAAKENDFNYIGVENDENSFNIANQRLKNMDNE